MNEITQWLLEGPPWLQYRTRIDLLDQPQDNPQVIAAREAMLAHPQIQDLLTELAQWPGVVLKTHKDAKHLTHKLAFIADLGLKADNPGVNKIIDLILEHQAQEGPFQILVNIPTHFGGTGKDQWAWMLCDAPLVLYSLIKFGLEKEPRVQSALQYLVGLIRDNGWPCAATPDLGKFKGPGRKDDPCPYANLLMLKVFSLLPEMRDEKECRIGAETLLDLWQKRKERKPFLFAMGTDFAKLKAPLIWYDILHVLDVLTRFSWLRKDTRLQEMVDIVKGKADEKSRYTPESIWMAWKGWDFGQKREPSQWVTFLVLRILNRLDK